MLYNCPHRASQNPEEDHDGDDHPSWNDDLDARLRTDYAGDYDRDRDYIRHAYEYRYQTA